MCDDTYSTCLSSCWVPYLPECPLENSTADTAFSRRMALQDVLLVLALANFGKCIICPGLLANSSTLFSQDQEFSRVFGKWVISKCEVNGVLCCNSLTFSFACVCLRELLGPFTSTSPTLPYEGCSPGLSLKFR